MGRASRRKRDRRLAELKAKQAKRADERFFERALSSKNLDDVYNALKVPKDMIYGRRRTLMYHPAVQRPSGVAMHGTAMHMAGAAAAASYMGTSPLAAGSKAQAVKTAMLGYLYGKRPDNGSDIRLMGIDWAEPEPDELPHSFMFGRSHVCGHCPRSLTCFQGAYPDVCERCRLVLTRHDELKHVKVFVAGSPPKYAEAHEAYHLERNRVSVSCPIFIASQQRCLLCDPTYNGTQRRKRKPARVVAIHVDGKPYKRFQPPRRSDAPIDSMKRFLSGRTRGGDLHTREGLRFLRTAHKRGHYPRT